MKTIQGKNVVLHDFDPWSDFKKAVLNGLGGDEKSIPSKFFYDQRGSVLFDQIGELEYYYLTRTELAIMHRSVAEMADCMGPRCRVVEFGSGSGTKTRILLDALEEPTAYVPVDISRDQLLAFSEELAQEYPDLVVAPVSADYSEELTLPNAPEDTRRTIIYFSGSTLGNISLSGARILLEKMKCLCNSDGGLLIGVDLQKDLEILERAYNDEAGVTAEFNLNLLRRVNRELGGDFDLNRFSHRAIYNSEAGRIEMYLVSERRQTVTVDDHKFTFDQGETICTEHSYKYGLTQFDDLALSAGFQVAKTWLDDDEMFTVKFLDAV